VTKERKGKRKKEGGGGVRESFMCSKWRIVDGGKKKMKNASCHAPIQVIHESCHALKLVVIDLCHELIDVMYESCHALIHVTFESCHT